MQNNSKSFPNFLNSQFKFAYKAKANFILEVHEIFNLK